MSKILITGANGMLGSCVASILKNMHHVYLTGRQNESIDHKDCAYLSKDLGDDDYSDLMSWSNPDYIIHCGAITDIRYCETHPSEAYKINSDSVKKFVQNEYASKLVLISSEAVYSGIPNSNEESNLAPGTVYAKSKLKAENYLKLDSGKNISIRTTIVGSKLREPHSGFVDWIINSLGQDKEIDLYEDNGFRLLPFGNCLKRLNIY